MRINLNKLFSVFFALLAFLLSLFLLHFYTKGDQLHYTAFYNGVHNFDFFRGYLFYNRSLGASEPIYYIIIYIFSAFLKKNFLIAMVNAILSYNVSLVLTRLQVNKLLIISLLLNFYMIVLFTGAERLKFSIAILSFYFLASGSLKQNSLLLLSVFTHFQTSLLAIGIKFKDILYFIRSIFLLRMSFKKVFLMTLLVLGSLGALVAFYLLQKQLMQKWNYYSSSQSLMNIIKPTIFLVLTLCYRKKISLLEIFGMFLPLIVISMLLGSERIVIFCYFVFFYYASRVNHGINIGILLSQSYFIYKGIDFIINILQHNKGFI